ncbi:MAG: RDD family protein [Candidatus Marinarcus sp.]|uniref:RDD family protein n=1 Tax=Candidatus Marinarcus sp. TaxID=3100987 RepID=UPI003B00CA0B
MNYEKQTDNQNLELASIGSRVKAFIIDDVLISLVFFLIYWEYLFSNETDLTTMLRIINDNVMQILMMKFVYQGFFVWYYGATLGKIVAKIRIVDYNDFGRVNFFNSFVRSFFRILSEMFFYIGFILAFFNEGKQTLQDKMGRTLVINA